MKAEREYIPYCGPIVTRADAKARGLLHYFMGTPCGRGHLSIRFTKSGQCAECARLKLKAKRSSIPLPPIHDYADTDSTKICRACKTEKPLTEFHKRGDGDGFRSICKDCHGERAKDARKADPDAHHVRDKRCRESYQARHPDRVRAAWQRSNARKSARAAEVRKIKEEDRWRRLLTVGKLCTKCGETKPLDLFYLDKKRIDGRQQHCKICCAAYSRAHREQGAAAQRRYKARNPDKSKEYYQANKERLRAANKAWRDANKDLRLEKSAARYHKQAAMRKELQAAEYAEWKFAREIELDRKIISKAEAKAAGAKTFFTGVECNNDHLAKRFVSTGGCVKCQAEGTRKWEKANPEKARAGRDAYQTTNADAIRKRKLDYYHKNRDRKNAVGRAWYAANKDRRCVTIMAWRSRNPEKLRSYAHNRRAREMNAEGFHTAEDIARIRKQQKDRCAHPWCRKRLKGKGHRDHRISLARGGTNWSWNIQLLCSPCNLKKNKKHPEDFAKENGYLV